nr:hypothetical protein [Geotalea toluenoxydans]
MNKTFKRKKLGDILVDNQTITPEQLTFVIDKLKSTSERFGAICLNEGLITDADLARALAEQFGLEYLDLQDFKPDETVLELLPPDAMQRFHFVPLELLGDALVVAISDPTDVLKLDEMELLLDRPVILKIAPESQILILLKKGEGARSVLKEVSEDFMLQLVTETDKGEEVLSVEKISADTSPIIKLVNSTILDALNRRTSDIHIETTQEGSSSSTASTGCYTKRQNLSICTSRGRSFPVSRS